jgi:hypothetical protein
MKRTRERQDLLSSTTPVREKAEMIKQAVVTQIRRNQAGHRMADWYLEQEDRVKEMRNELDPARGASARSAHGSITENNSGSGA